jgi:hypothetical protein
LNTLFYLYSPADFNLTIFEKIYIEKIGIPY